MSNNKRGRGRPRGTGLDDSPTLKKVADLLADDPSLAPTTAMKRVLPKPDETTVRRLQVKWREQGAKYLADAQARRAAVPAPTRGAGASYAPRTIGQIVEAQRKMQDALGPGFRAAQELMNTPGMAAAREAARRYHEDPTLRAFREIQNDPVVRAMREFHNSPEARLLREMQAAKRLLGGF